MSMKLFDFGTLKVKQAGGTAQTLAVIENITANIESSNTPVYDDKDFPIAIYSGAKTFTGSFEWQKVDLGVLEALMGGTVTGTAPAGVLTVKAENLNDDEYFELEAATALNGNEVKLTVFNCKVSSAVLMSLAKGADGSENVSFEACQNSSGEVYKIEYTPASE